MKDLKILHIEDKCTGCAACVNICPKKCLRLSTDKVGFYYPQYNDTDCIDCHLCEKTCHIISSSKKEITKDNLYIYHTNDDDLREKSTSGGAFSLFANYVLNLGGVVYGSKYNDTKERLEVCSTADCSIDDLRKSKYIESYTGASFSEIRKDLIKGRVVLYCGTPCQVIGLINYLETTKTVHENLITLDFVCHGVPSNSFFTEFKHLNETSKRKIVNVDFRYKNFIKKTFWHDMTMALHYADGTTKEIAPCHYGFKLYYRQFHDNLILRESCYSCDSIWFSRADFTIGDFWAITGYDPQLDDNKGISFVKVNNITKKELFLQLANNDFIEPIDFDINNHQYQHRSWGEVHTERNQLMSSIINKGYLEAIKEKYGYTPFVIARMKFYGEIKYFIKKLLR